MKLSIPHLRAAGITDKQIVDVIQETEAKRREQDRIRQRNHRARNASHGDMRDMRDTKDRIRQRNHRARNASHGDMRDMRDTNIEVSKKEESKEVSVARSSRAKKPMTPLPENWHPELAGEIEFEKFCDHARQNDRRCVDWEAALRNWKRNAPRFNGGGKNVHGRRHGSVLDAFDRLGEKLKAAGASDDYVPGSSGPRPLELDPKMRPTGLKLIPKR